MDQSLNTDDTDLAKLTLDDAVGGDSCAVSSNLNTTLISTKERPGGLVILALIDKLFRTFTGL